MDWKPCVGCGSIETESIHPCVFCGKDALFCSPHCCWDNYEEHLFDGCRAYKEHQNQLEKRIQATPRSVFDSVIFHRIEMDRELCKRLFLKFRISELQIGKGCLVLRVKNTQGLCILMNRSLDQSNIVNEMSEFETCVSLTKNKIERAVSNTRMAIKLSDDVHCNRFLYCVIVENTKVLTRVFKVPQHTHPLDASHCLDSQ